MIFGFKKMQTAHVLVYDEETLILYSFTYDDHMKCNFVSFKTISSFFREGLIKR